MRSYYYVVRAVNAGGSSLSEEAEAYTPPLPPSASMLASASAPRSIEIALTWSCAAPVVDLLLSCAAHPWRSYSPLAGVLGPAASIRRFRLFIRHLLLRGAGHEHRRVLLQTRTRSAATRPFNLKQDDDFSTDSRTSAAALPDGLRWGLQQRHAGSLRRGTRSGALRAYVNSSPSSPVPAMRYRAVGWVCNQGDWLPVQCDRIGQLRAHQVLHVCFGHEQAVEPERDSNFRLRQTGTLLP